MNSLNIPDKKIERKCCSNCGKEYKIRSNLEKHKMVCDILMPKNNDIEEAIIPSQKTLYKMLLELGQKFNRMEEKMSEMSKMVVKKKNINILDWLKNNLKPDYTFEYLPDKIIVVATDIEYLFNNNFYDTLNGIFIRTIYSDINVVPLFVFKKKIYSYEKEGWVELTRENLTRFLNNIHLKMSKVLFEWKKNHRDEINSNDTISIMYDKTMVKLMSVEVKQENTYSRIKNMMEARLKTDIKTMIEYDVE